jgi:hypothetical protein
MPTNPEHFSLPKVITTSIHVDRMARQLRGIQRNTMVKKNGHVEENVKGNQCRSLLCMASVWFIMVNQMLRLCTVAMVKFASFSECDFGEKIILYTNVISTTVTYKFYMKEFSYNKSSWTQPKMHSRTCVSYNLQSVIRITTQ